MALPFIIYIAWWGHTLPSNTEPGRSSGYDFRARGDERTSILLFFNLAVMFRLEII